MGRAVEKPIDFWLRKGQAGGEPKPTEKKVTSSIKQSGIDFCNLLAEREGDRFGLFFDLF